MRGYPQFSFWISIAPDMIYLSHTVIVWEKILLINGTVNTKKSCEILMILFSFSLSYDKALNEAGIPTIFSCCEDICDLVFNAALGNKYKHNKLLTEANIRLHVL